jgi:hypothetical protein
MGDRTDTANVIVRPPIAWALAVLARLAYAFAVRTGDAAGKV